MASYDLFSDDLVQEKALISRSVKSDEEIERQTVDENLHPIERAVYLLSSGQEVQQVSVVSSLPDLLRDSYADCMRRVVPKVKEVLHVAQSDMQCAACTTFVKILRDSLVPVPKYVETFLQSILSSIDHKDSEIASNWLKALLDVIDLLPNDSIRKYVLPVALNRGQLTQSVQSRITCCKILGRLCLKFDVAMNRKDVIPSVQALCQDVEYEVRAAMCRQLGNVGKALGNREAENIVLPELVELATDEAALVREASFDTLVAILPYVDTGKCVRDLAAMALEFSKRALSADDSVVVTVACQYGALCTNLTDCLAEDQRKPFSDVYKRLCKVGLKATAESTKSSQNVSRDSSKSSQSAVGSPPKAQFSIPLFTSADAENEDPHVQCRKYAALCFPAMMSFVPAGNYKSDLHVTFVNLCSDNHSDVRGAIASVFHKVVQTLGSAAHMVQSELVTLLKDDCVEVLSGLVKGLSVSLKTLSLALTDADGKYPMSVELIPAIHHCKSVVFASRDWRLQQELMAQLTCLPDILTSQEVYTRFVPQLFLRLRKARALPVRRECARTLLVVLRRNERLEQRREICRRIVEDIAQHPSSYKRHLFIDICFMAVDMFSRAFFKEYFFEAALRLMTDKVPNIRLRVCPLLPIMKRMLKIPGEKSLQQWLETGCQKLMLSERDRDVRPATEQALRALDSVQVRVRVEPMNKQMMTDSDVEDKHKEDEEKYLLELEEREKKEEKAAKDTVPKRDVNNKATPVKKTPLTKTAAGKEASDSSAAAKEFRRSASLKGKPEALSAKTNVTRSSSIRSTWTPQEQPTPPTRKVSTTVAPNSETLTSGSSSRPSRPSLPLDTESDKKKNRRVSTGSYPGNEEVSPVTGTRKK